MLTMTQTIRPARRSLIGTVIGTVGLTLALSVSSAFAATGNNGTVKVHDSATDPELVNNEPHVCEFYLAFYFADPAESGDWEIVSWDGTGSVVASGSYLTDADGFYRTDDMSLPDGHYRVNWQGINDTSWKHKMFWVDCAALGAVAQGATQAQGAAAAVAGAAEHAQGAAHAAAHAGGAGLTALREGGVQAAQGGPGQGELPDAAMRPLEPTGVLVALGVLMTVAGSAILRMRRQIA